MGMGNYANSAYVIDEKFVREMAGKELNALIKTLEENNSSLQDFMESEGKEEIDDLSIDNKDALNLIKQLWANLQTVFQKTTGLELYIIYHEREDRGDEIDHAVWCVDGVMQRTPAGEKYKKEIEYKTWTVFG